MCSMYKITTVRYSEVTRTICTGKVQHPANTDYPKTNNQQKFVPRRSILFLHRTETRCWTRRLIRFLQGYGSDFRRIIVPIAAEISPFSKTCRQSVGPTQPPIHWVPGAWPHSDKDMKHTAHPHLLPGQISGTMPQLRLHVFIHAVNSDTVSPAFSKQNERV